MRTIVLGGAGDMASRAVRELTAEPVVTQVMNCYHLGHPEPVTLSRFLPGVKTVTLKGGLSEQSLDDLASR